LGKVIGLFVLSGGE